MEPLLPENGTLRNLGCGALKTPLLQSSSRGFTASVFHAQYQVVLKEKRVQRMLPSLLCRLRKQEALFSFRVARALLPACLHLEPIHPWWACLHFTPDGGKLGQWRKFPALQRYTWMTLMCVSSATWLTAPSFILDIRPRSSSDFLIIPCNSLADQLSPIHQDTCIYARWMKKNTELIPLSGKMGSNKEPVRPVENSCWMAICESYLHDPELPGLGLIAVCPAASTTGSVGCGGH